MTIVEFLEARLPQDEAEADSARALREVAAKRRLVELYGSLSAQWAPNVDYGFAQTTLRTLAAIYSDHPDYKNEWELK